ncbi:MAG: cyanophycinase [Clostridiales bacterium]|nr:cyanophycinase [Clostridiales bacterium]
MKGTLIIVGGGVNRSEEEIFSLFIEKAGGVDSKIAFIVTASGEGPDELFRSYRQDFAKLGFPEENLSLIPLYAQHVKDERGFNAMTGDFEGLEQSLDGVNGVWFTGGDQYFTNRCLLRPDGSDTKLLARLREIYQNGGVIGGSSAGAAIMSRAMIGNGNNRGVLASDEILDYSDYDALCEIENPCQPLVLDKGLGFFKEGVVDQHFDKRPRLLRLIKACISNREGQRIGYAVSEDTALIYDNGHISVVGSSSIYIADCRNAKETGRGCFEGVMLSAIQRGDSLNLPEMNFHFASKISAEKEGYHPDYVNNGIINSPSFDKMIDERLLRAEDSSMYIDSKDRRFVKGAVVYDVEGTTWLCVLKYSRSEKTEGYMGTRASFTGVGLDICSKIVET